VASNARAPSLVSEQGCQMVHLHTKNTRFGYILEGLRMEKLSIFVAIWYICGQFSFICLLGIFFGHLVHFTANWYINAHLVYFRAIRYISRPLGIFHGH
jgi:hypothetical protein